jgi:hypothetical protein
MEGVTVKENRLDKRNAVARAVSPSRRVDQEVSGFADHCEALFSQAGWQAMVDTRPQEMAQRQRRPGISGSPLQPLKTTATQSGNMIAGLEHLSGRSMDDERVHGNSAKPAAIGAQVAMSIYRRLGGGRGSAACREGVQYEH